MTSMWECQIGSFGLHWKVIVANQILMGQKRKVTRMQGPRLQILDIRWVLIAQSEVYGSIREVISAHSQVLGWFVINQKLRDLSRKMIEHLHCYFSSLWRWLREWEATTPELWGMLSQLELRSRLRTGPLQMVRETARNMLSWWQRFSETGCITRTLRWPFARLKTLTGLIRFDSGLWGQTSSRFTTL